MSTRKRRNLRRQLDLERTRSPEDRGERRHRAKMSPRSQKDYKGFESEVRHALQSEAGDPKHRSRFLERLSTIFGKVDAWGGQETGVEKFRKDFKKILEEISDIETESSSFDRHLDRLMDTIDTNEDGKISFSEFVTFYMYASDELRDLVKEISRKINRNALEDESYIRRWQHIFTKSEGTFSPEQLIKLFIDFLDVKISLSESKLLVSNIGVRKRGKSIQIHDIQRFLRYDCAANLHFVENQDPIFGISVSVNKNQEESLTAKGYIKLPLDLNKGKLLNSYTNPVHLWYTKNDNGGHLEPVTDVCIYPHNESTTLYADGFTCINRSTNAGLFGAKGGYGGTAVYIWTRSGPGGPKNQNAITNIMLTTQTSSDHLDITTEIPAGGYQMVRGDLNLKSSGNKIHLWTRKGLKKHTSKPAKNQPKRVQLSPRLEDTKEDPKSYVEKLERQALNGKSGDLVFDAVFHRLRRDIRLHSSIKKGNVDIHEFYLKFAKQHVERGWTKKEFKAAMKSKELSVNIPEFALEKLMEEIDSDGDGKITQSDYRDFVQLRPFELENIASEIVVAIMDDMDIDGDVHDRVDEIIDEYGNKRGNIDKDGFERLAKDYRNLNFTSTEVDRMLALVDSNMNNFITKEEMVHFLTSHKQIILQASTFRLLQAAQLLRVFVEKRYAEFIERAVTRKRGKISNMPAILEEAAVAMWSLFNVNIKVRKGTQESRGAPEFAKVLKLAAAEMKVGVACALGFQELENLMRFIQPNAGENLPCVDFHTFQHFFNLGASTNNFVTDILVTHGRVSTVEQKEVDAMNDGYYRAGVGLLEGDTSVTKLWVKYGPGTRAKPFIRQIEIAPKNCRLQRKESWEMVTSFLRHNEEGTAMFIWYSREASSSSDYGNVGLHEIKLQREKPRAYVDLTFDQIVKFKADEIAEDLGIPIWTRFCEAQTGPYVIADKVGQQISMHNLQRGDIVQILARVSGEWEEAKILKVNRSESKTTYDVIHEDDGSQERNISPKNLRISHHALASRSELNFAYQHHKENQKGSVFSLLKTKLKIRERNTKSITKRASKSERHKRQSASDFFDSSSEDTDSGDDFESAQERLLRKLKKKIRNEDIDIVDALEQRSVNGNLSISAALQLVKRACSTDIDRHAFQKLLETHKIVKNSKVSVKNLSSLFGYRSERRSSDDDENISSGYDTTDSESSYSDSKEEELEKRTVSKKKERLIKKISNYIIAQFPQVPRTTPEVIKEWIKQISSKVIAGSNVKKQLAIALKKNGVKLKSSELKLYFEFLSIKGEVSLGKLHRHLQTVVRSQNSETGRSVWTSSATEVELVRKISAVLKRSTLKHSEIIEKFQEYDINFNDSVPLKHFRSISSQLGFGLSSSECRRVYSLYPLDGGIAYKKLFKKVGLTDTRDSPLLVNLRSEEGNVLSELKRLVKDASVARGEIHGCHVSRPFEYYDKDGTGTITRDQFRLGLEKLGVGIDNNEVSVLLAKLEVEGDGMEIDYKAFCELIGSSNIDMTKLQEKVSKALYTTTNSGVGFYDVFADVDTNGDGRVSRFRFRETLKRLCITLEEEEYRALMDKFDTESDGRVNYGSFYRWASPFGSKVAIDTDALQCRLQHRIREAAMIHPAGFDLRKPFSYFDTGNVGLVTRGEFKRAMDDLNMSISKGELSYLMDRFGRDRQTVDYFTFAKFAKCDEAEMDIIAHRLHSRFDDIAREGLDYREVFSMFDTKLSGFISRFEFKEAARQLGLPITLPQLHALMERFGHFAGGDQVSYQDVFDFVNVRYGTTSASSTGLPQIISNQTRDSVDGNGLDGLDTKTFETALAIRESNFFAPSTVERWLENSASKKQKEAFSSIYESLNRFDSRRGAGANMTGIAIFDHRDNSVSKMVSHLPFQTAVLGTSKFRKSTSSYNDHDDRSDDSYSSIDDPRRRGRSERKSPSRRGKQKSSRESSSHRSPKYESDDSIDGDYRQSSRSRKASSRSRSATRRHDLSDSEDDSSYSPRRSKRNHTKKRGVRSRYSEDSSSDSGSY